jgi:hypothetical protein
LIVPGLKKHVQVYIELVEDLPDGLVAPEGQDQASRVRVVKARIEKPDKATTQGCYKKEVL